ncbi:MULTISPECIES: beta-lactamase regulator AmpE [Rheinheimera]|uniref:Beta-lactamase regulator AmpE n=1 Tax=Rheinheimera marina TaxID=1774958 RepID=A0ABV9JPA5_9GAMM
MTLISMLIALIVERLAVRSDAWQFWPYARKYLSFSRTSAIARLASHPQGQYLWLVLPGLLYALLLWLIDSGLVSLVLNTLVLLVCIGCWHYRQQYKHYLNATERGDNEAAFLTMQQISKDAGLTEQELSYGQRLVWLNFRYYAAVLFWFALFGGAGALTYALLRQLSEPVLWQADAETAVTETELVAVEEGTETYQAQQAEVDPDAESNAAPASQWLDDLQPLQRLMFWADWLPARIFGLGLALVGHFSRASAALIGFFANTHAPASTVITTVAKAAEPLPEDSYNCSEETACMVQLSKRNVLFFLALVAVLTLSGWVR